MQEFFIIPFIVLGFYGIDGFSTKLDKLFYFKTLILTMLFLIITDNYENYGKLDECLLNDTRTEYDLSADVKRSKYDTDKTYNTLVKNECIQQKQCYDKNSEIKCYYRDDPTGNSMMDGKDASPGKRSTISTVDTSDTLPNDDVGEISDTTSTISSIVSDKQIIISWTVYISVMLIGAIIIYIFSKKYRYNTLIKLNNENRLPFKIQQEKSDYDTFQQNRPQQEQLNEKQVTQQKDPLAQQEDQQNELKAQREELAARPTEEAEELAARPAEEAEELAAQRVEEVAAQQAEEEEELAARPAEEAEELAAQRVEEVAAQQAEEEEELAAQQMEELVAQQAEELAAQQAEELAAQQAEETEEMEELAAQQAEEMEELAAQQVEELAAQPAEEVEELAAQQAEEVEELAAQQAEEMEELAAQQLKTEIQEVTQMTEARQLAVQQVAQEASEAKKAYQLRDLIIKEQQHNPSTKLQTMVKQLSNDFNQQTEEAMDAQEQLEYIEIQLNQEKQDVVDMKEQLQQLQQDQPQSDVMQQKVEEIQSSNTPVINNTNDISIGSDKTLSKELYDSIILESGQSKQEIDAKLNILRNNPELLEPKKNTITDINKTINNLSEADILELSNMNNMSVDDVKASFARMKS